MNKIKILPPQEAQKIAAGEVVERPVHVLKELFENAIDAGASQIVIHIEEAGKKLIRIADNGCGMSYEDAVLCVAPHATSKISSVGDLVGVATYGFRGEALASVAAVSYLTLITRNEETDYGWQLKFKEGSVEAAERVPAEQGTTLEVRDLFYNVPARKKFLKQDETEWNQLQQLVYAMALSHLKISFKLFHNNKLIVHTPQALTLQDRAAQLWGMHTANQFVALSSGMQKGVSVEGIITSHQSWRYGKHQIFFFVNSRWVKNQELVKALLKGYSNVLPPGKFPAGVVLISIDPVVIDVNVHPKKEEVRFTKPQVVSAAVTENVQNTLRQETFKTVTTSSGLEAFSMPPQNREKPLQFSLDTQKPFAGVEEKLNAEENEPAAVRRIVINNDTASTWPLRPASPSVFRQLGDIFERDVEVSDQKMPTFLPESSRETPAAQRAQAALFQQDSSQVAAVFGGKLIGQILNTYLIVEGNRGLVLVDQHAAHERILYERMKDRVTARESSLLLFAQLITLTAHEIEVLEQFEEQLKDFGISFDRMGPHAIALKAVPLGIAQIDLEELLRQAAALIIKQEHLPREIVQRALYEHVHSHLACKKAVKAGDVLTREQMERLLQDLLTVEKPFICIHGRPTYWRLSQAELERFFRR